MDKEKLMVNLFLIGAPKTGTTTLYHYFKNHNDIFVPKVKEPGFFSNSMLTAWYTRKAEGYELDYEVYSKLFREEGYRYNADCSTSYLRNPKALKEIYQRYPEAKIIVCLRNPYELVVSWHYQKVKEGQESIYNFKKAWEKSNYGKRLDKDHIYRTDSLDYKKIGKIGSQLENVLEIFPAKNVLVLNYDELRQNEKFVLEKTAAFLSISNFVPKDIKANTSNQVTPEFIRKISKKYAVLGRVISLGKRILPNKFVRVFKKNQYNPIQNIQYLKQTNYFKDEVVKIEDLTGIQY